MASLRISPLIKFENRKSQRKATENLSMDRNRKSLMTFSRKIYIYTSDLQPAELIKLNDIK